MSAESVDTIFLSLERFKFLSRPAFITTAVAALRQRGLARSGPGSLEVGAKYTVKGYSARNGNPMGFMKTLVFPDGKEVVFWFGDPNGN